MIFDMFDLVGKAHKTPVNIIQGPTVKLITQLLAANAQGVTAGMLAQHQS